MIFRTVTFFLKQCSDVFEVADFNAFLVLLYAPERGEIMVKAGVLERPKMYNLEDLLKTLTY